MAETPKRSSRVLIIGLVATVGALSLALVVQIIATSGPSAASTDRINVLENSDDPCVTCHRSQSPGIVEQYGHSSMAAADVSCSDCHVVDDGYAGSAEHEGANVLARPTAAVCGRCHEAETAQFHQSRHGLPAYVAYAGTEDLSSEHLERVTGRPFARRSCSDQVE